jgi:predicted oxidoreductase
MSLKKYQIPNTDLDVSRIGYGCMKLGGQWDESPILDSDRNTAHKAVLTAVDQGITLYDHADIYMMGKSEIVFAQIMEENKGMRKKIILQSKCGIRFANQPSKGDPFRYDFSYAHIISSVEGILNRLKTDYLDILLLHRPDPLVQPQELARAFAALRKEGKVRYFGVSNHNAAQIALLQKYVDQKLVINQVELSLLHAHMINDGIIWNVNDPPIPASGGTLEYCRQNEMMIQAWGPVASGRLIDPPQAAEKHTKDTVKLITAMAAEKKVSKEAIVLGWLLQHPAAIQPLIGTVNVQRIKNSCQADNVILSREEWYRLFEAARGKQLP